MKKINNKGITLVSLVITIIIIVIIASVSINYASDILNKSGIESIETNMLLIEAKVKLYAEEYNFSGDTSQLYGTKVSETTESLVVNFNANAGNIYSSYYYLNTETLSQMGLSIKSGNYLVNYDYDNIDVVYIEGITVDGVMYHTLSEIESL